MYGNYMPRKISYSKDTRFVPFAGPFLLGALTGGVAVAPLFKSSLYIKFESSI